MIAQVRIHANLCLRTRPHLCEYVRMPVSTDLRPGARIRTRREELDISTRVFAERIGIAEGSLRNIENGRAVPSRRLIGRICRELTLPIHEIDDAYADVRKERERTAEPTSPPKRQDKEPTKGPKRATGVAA